MSARADRQGTSASASAIVRKDHRTRIPPPCGNGQANVLFPRLSRLPFLPSGAAPYICRVASSQIYRNELGLQLGAAANPSIGRLASILMHGGSREARLIRSGGARSLDAPVMQKL